MPHTGEALSRAHISSCLIVAWEMLKYIHLWGLFMGTVQNSEIDLAQACAQQWKAVQSDWTMSFYPFLGGVKISGDVIRVGT